MAMLAPRLYNLHPLLAGPIERWPEHLPRIAAMGFDWVYVNAFWAPGASGSIYAVADPYELHPRVRGDARGPAHELVQRFIEAAREHGSYQLMQQDLALATTPVAAALPGNEEIGSARVEYRRRA